jgi:hypothetical protein
LSISLSHVFNFHSADIFNFRLYHCHMFSIFIPPTSLTFVYIIVTRFQFSFRWHLYLLSISFWHVFNFHSTNIFTFRLYHCCTFSIFIPLITLIFVYITCICLNFHFTNNFNFRLYHCRMFSIFILQTYLTFAYIIIVCVQFSFRWHL